MPSISWLPVLQIRFSKQETSRHDAWSHSDCGLRPDGNSCFGRGNTNLATGAVVWNAQTAVAVSGSWPASACELRDAGGFGRNSGEREGKSSRRAFSDAAAEIGRDGSGKLLVVPDQGNNSGESRTANTLPNSLAGRKLDPTRWELEQER
jgi:hypothetical protein